MAWSFLESALVGACPSFRDTWSALRRARPADVEPDVREFLGALTAHAEWLLVEGRVAEFARLLRGVERLLDGADPILEDLLKDGILRPLAAAARDGRVDSRLVLPHLGPRSRAAWQAS